MEKIEQNWSQLLYSVLYYNKECKIITHEYILDIVSLISWWRHQTEAFFALLAICAGNSLVPGEFLAQKPVTRSFDVLFDLRLNKWLSKQSWGCLFERPSRPLWRHCNVSHHDDKRYPAGISPTYYLIYGWSIPVSVPRKMTKLIILKCKNFN